MKKTLIIVLLWLFIVNIFAVIGANRFNLKSDTAYTWIKEAEFRQEHSWNPINIHSKWDSLWYLDIAQNGYSYRGENNLSNIVFSPLYPFLVNIFSIFFAGNFILTGWFLSSVFLILSSIFLFKLTKEFYPQIDPHLPVLFLLIFPTAFFLNALYSEALFLFLSISSIYWMHKGKLWYAGIFGFFVALTRVVGVLIFIPLAIEYYLANKNKKLIKKEIIPIFFPPIATFLFLLFHYFRFGDFMLFFKVESTWGRAFIPNLDHLKFFTNPAVINFGMDLFFLIFAIVVSFLVAKKIRLSYGMYMLAATLVVVSTGTIMSIGRYTMVLFPIYLYAASLKSDIAKYVWAFASILLFAIYTILFVNGYWAG